MSSSWPSAVRAPAFGCMSGCPIYQEYINDEWIDPALLPAVRSP